MSVTVAVEVNGVQRQIQAGTTVGDVVSRLLPRADGCAVAVNGSVISRAQWPEVTLQMGDRIEVVTPTSGG